MLGTTLLLGEAVMEKEETEDLRAFKLFWEFSTAGETLPGEGERLNMQTINL